MTHAESPWAFPSSYEEAIATFNRDKDRPEFQRYRDEFIEWSNHFELDTRNNCYSKGAEPVKLLLVITSRAVIEPVISSIGGSKAECFRLSYLARKVKPPPYEPLVIELNMK
jgi:hypothetical protein